MKKAFAFEALTLSQILREKNGTKRLRRWFNRLEHWGELSSGALMSTTTVYDFLAKSEVRNQLCKTRFGGNQEVHELFVLCVEKFELASLSLAHDVELRRAQKLVEVLLSYPISERTRNILLKLSAEAPGSPLADASVEEFLTDYDLQRMFARLEGVGEKSKAEAITFGQFFLRDRYSEVPKEKILIVSREPGVSLNSHLDTISHNDPVTGESERLLSLPEISFCKPRLRNALKKVRDTSALEDLTSVTARQFIEDRIIQERFLSLENLGQGSLNELFDICISAEKRRSEEMGLKQQLLKRHYPGQNFSSLLLDRHSPEDSHILEKLESDDFPYKDIHQWVQEDFHPSKMIAVGLSDWHILYLKALLLSDHAEEDKNHHSEHTDFLWGAALTKRQYEIIDGRYGISNGNTHTLEQLGKTLNLTRERIRQLEKQALNRLIQNTDEKIKFHFFLEKNREKIAENIFARSSAVKMPKKPDGISMLAIRICYGTWDEYLKFHFELINSYWFRGDKILAATVIDIIDKSLQTVSQPIEISSILSEYNLTDSFLAGCADASNSSCFLSGKFLIPGSKTAKKIRQAYILALLTDECSPVLIDEIEMISMLREKYNYTNISPRALRITLFELEDFVVNLKQFKWANLRAFSSKNLIGPVPAAISAPDEVVEKIFTSAYSQRDGMDSAVLQFLKDVGVCNQKQAAEEFAKLHSPKYSSGSFSVLTTIIPFVEKFSPGVIGLWNSKNDPKSLSQGRALLLDKSVVRQYVMAKESGALRLQFTLWDLEMEKQWAEWLRSIDDKLLLGRLLSVVEISRWSYKAHEGEFWEQTKKRLESNELYSREGVVLDEKFITTEHLFRVLLTSALLDVVTWLEVNLGLGWVLSSRRAIIPLAICVRAGWVIPKGEWFEGHNVTELGRTALASLVSDGRIDGSFEISQMFPHGLVGDLVFGEDSWAAKYSPEFLKNALVAGRERFDNRLDSVWDPDAEDDLIVDEVDMQNARKFLENL